MSTVYLTNRTPVQETGVEQINVSMVYHAGRPNLDYPIHTDSITDLYYLA